MKINKKDKIESLSIPKDVTFNQLTSVEEGNSKEIFTLLASGSTGSLIAEYDKLRDMEFIFPKIPVRKTIAQKLERASIKLISIDPRLRLKVTYGYRSLSVQKRYFRQISKELFGNERLTETETEQVHRLIAVPTIAGHPTGGAVDVTLVNVNSYEPVDMGSDLYDFNSDAIEVFSKNLSCLQKANRFLLRRLLLEEGLAPFDGEWWHFSYGDKEWAYYYGRSKSLYPQITTRELRKMLK